MNSTHATTTDADRSLDAHFARALPRAEHRELDHARARRALLAAAELAVKAAPEAHRRRLRVVTALAFAATAAAAATLATRFEAARHDSPAEVLAAQDAPRPARATAHGTPAEEIAPQEAAAPTATAPQEAAAPHAPELRAPAARRTITEPRAVAQEPNETPKAGARFAEAMGAYLAGDYARADGLFESFTAEFPSDARVEDALFLRAEARSRRGDEAGARAAARAYLKRFPAGLRRPEAERLAAEGL